jgi:hypothetical protein
MEAEDGVLRRIYSKDDLVLVILFPRFMAGSVTQFQGQ